MAIGVLLLAVGSVLGKDHGIGSIITGAIKSGAGAGVGRRKVKGRRIFATAVADRGTLDVPVGESHQRFGDRLASLGGW